MEFRNQDVGKARKNHYNQSEHVNNKLILFFKVYINPYGHGSWFIYIGGYDKSKNNRALDQPRKIESKESKGPKKRKG